MKDSFNISDKCKETFLFKLEFVLFHEQIFLTTSLVSIPKFQGSCLCVQLLNPFCLTLS